MGSAYTPGLTVSADTVVQRLRRLPIKGEVMVREGDTVGFDTVVARAMLPGLLQTIKLSEQLGVEAKEVASFFHKQIGDTVEKNEVVAETKGFIFGWGKSQATSPATGSVESISEITGNILVREAPIPVDMVAYINGRIVKVIPEEGVVVETRGAMVQGIFGVGGERNGPIRISVESASEILDVQHIQDSDQGMILIGGSGVTYEALVRANDVKVAGIVVGAIRDVDLIKFLGYDIGVAITGQEEINTTIIATEGFGKLNMAERTFKLLKSIEGRSASLNGATQIRAGVIRPEVIAPTEKEVSGAPEAQAESTLTLGTPIRVIREPYFGMLGKVTELPPQLHTVESGAEVRVLKAMLDNGQEVLVPRANVEIIATS